MGQTLSEPSQEKHTTSGVNGRHAFAVSEMQGWRISMEDAHATVLELDDREKNAFFAVYDGHGGASIAKYSGQHVHTRLLHDEAYAAKDYRTALKRAFLGTDDDLRADPAFYHDPSGCTAVAVLLTSNDQIFCANAGDSRAVMSVKGVVKPLSYDHKPQNLSETARINAAGGYVDFNRVNGNLALSRAIGDFEFKQNFSLPPEDQIVTVNPEIIVHDITSEDEFIVMACDGIWDCMPSQDVVNWTRHQISERKPLEKICEDMMSRCLSPDSDVAGGIGCDNMTVLVLAILNGRTLDEWYDWMVERVEKKVGHNTPRTYENLYPPPRMGLGMSGGGFGARDGISNFGGPNSEPPSFLSPSWLQRLNRPLYLSQTGLSSILPVSNSPAGLEDSGEEFEDEDSEEEEEVVHSSMIRNSIRHGSSLHAPPARDSTSSLRAQLEAIESKDNDEEMGSSEDGDFDGDEQMMHLEEEDDDDDVYHPLNPRPPRIIGAPVIPSPQPLADLGTQSRPLQNPSGGPAHREAASPRLSINQEKSPTEQVRAKPADDAPNHIVNSKRPDTSDSPTKM